MSPPTLATVPEPGTWNVDLATALYNVPAWSEDYFSIRVDGHLAVRPRREAAHAIDLCALTDELCAHGLTLPVLVRFPDVLADRVQCLEEAFRSAIQRYRYQARYQALYPVKVNQQRSVVQTLARCGAGLEAGSKPELMLALALAEPGTPIACNGHKDREYIQLALAGSQLGLQMFLVVEKLAELNLILELAAQMRIKPLIGMRVRLHSIASGNWQNTGGEKSKFGLHGSELLQAIERLRASGQMDALRLLHFHVGSQVSDVRHFQRALQEGARYYAELRHLGAPIDWVDVGGGLGVDYEGTRSVSDCSMNYSIQEYADTVIGALALICQQQPLPQVGIFTECGRALAAHHAMLITDVIHVEQPPGAPPPLSATAQKHPLLRRLYQLLAELNAQNAGRACHYAHHCREQAREMFVHGLLRLAELAIAEQLYFTLCRRARPLLNGAPQKLVQALEERLADKYFCNFPLFQAAPDAWAINQVFPIMPLQRLHERPQRRATLHDLTCDADGRINRYVESGRLQNSLALHLPGRDERYLIGIFLLGAYQEILGDMHNLFGDTASLNVELDGDGHRIRETRQGDSAAELLQYVNLPVETLVGAYRRKLRQAKLTPEQERRYLEIITAGLHGCTYLQR